MRLIVLPFAFALSLWVTAQNGFDAAIIGYVGLRYPCNGEVLPTLRIQNQGTNTMLTCVVETWKNGVIDNSFNWVLATAAPTGAVRQPSLPPLTGLVQGDTLEFRIIDVNGVLDQGPADNVYKVPLDVVPEPADHNTLLVVVSTDALPAETSWALRGAGGQVLAQGGPYATANEVDSVWVTAMMGECLQLQVNDAGGDGMAGGNVRVYDASGLVAEVDGSTFTDVAFYGVVAGNATGIATERSDETALRVAPVPTTGPLTVTVQQGLTALEGLELMDATGRVIRVVRSASLHGGAIHLDLSGEAEGVYFLRSRFTDGQVRSGRVAVTR